MKIKKISIVVLLINCIWNILFLNPSTVHAETLCEKWSDNYSEAVTNTHRDAEAICKGSCDQAEGICKTQGFGSDQCVAQKEACEHCKQSFLDTDSDYQNYIGYICTDLVEGIPINLLEETGTRCASEDGINEAAQDDICYAVISPTGIGGLESYAALIYKYAGWFIGILAFVRMSFAGLQITMGGMNPEALAAGKKAGTQVCVGIGCYFLIGAILRTVNPNFFG